MALVPESTQGPHEVPEIKSGLTTDHVQCCSLGNHAERQISKESVYLSTYLYINLFEKWVDFSTYSTFAR